jgi:hypothetical protein
MVIVLLLINDRNVYFTIFCLPNVVALMKVNEVSNVERFEYLRM